MKSEIWSCVKALLGDKWKEIEKESEDSLLLNMPNNGFAYFSFKHILFYVLLLQSLNLIKETITIGSVEATAAYKEKF